LAEEKNITYTGANLLVNVKVTNTNSHVAMSMTSPSFMLCGIRMSHGQALQDTLFTLDAAGTQSTAPQQVPASGLLLTLQPAHGTLTLDQIRQLNTYCFLKVDANSLNISYQVSGTSSTLQLNTMLASVGSKTARITVDFDHCISGQEDPFIRSVATLTQPNPANIATPATYHGPMFLGELLHNMGLTYTADSTGFVSINGLKRDSNNIWVTQIIREATFGGLKSDTIETKMGKGSGPDAIIKTGDQVFLSYSGDDDRDSVPNCVAKMYGIYATADHPSKAWHDFDGDGVSNYNEIYGWVSSGGDTVCTDPSNADCDGDGIPDGQDPHPLVPRQATAANLLTLGMYGDLYDSALIQSISFAASAHTGAITGSIPCYPHFLITVDTPAIWVTIKESNGDSLVLSDTTWSDSNKTTHVVTRHFGYTDRNWIGKRNPLPLGAASFIVTTMPLNKGATQSWTIKGTSSMQNILGVPTAASSPVTTTTDGGPWWQQLKVTINNVVKQVVSDPRVTGYLVFRKISAGAASDTFDVTTQTGDVSGTVHNGWSVCKNITDLTRDTTFYDAGLSSGVTYTYRVIPYNKSTTTYTYGASAAGEYSPGVSTWRIRTCVKWNYWHCALSNFSSSAYAEMWVINDSRGIIDTLGHNASTYGPVANGTNYPLNWAVTFNVQPGDSLWTNIIMTHYADNNTAFAVSVDNLLKGVTSAKGVFDAGVGGVFSDDGQSHPTNNFSLIRNATVPTVSTPNDVTFGSETNNDGNWGAGSWGSDIGQMEFQWWFAN
jgi:hypothetical protein